MFSSPVYGKTTHNLRHINKGISHSYNIHATVCSCLQKSLLSLATPETDLGKEQHLYCCLQGYHEPLPIPTPALLAED